MAGTSDKNARSGNPSLKKYMPLLIQDGLNSG